MAKKKILMITYGFPPRGGGGVQRNVKFLKYLARLGWETNVLTVKATEFYVYDSTLLDEVKDTRIYRAESFDPLRVFSKFKKFFKKIKPKKLNQENSKIEEDAWYVGFYRKIRDIILLPDAYGGWIPFAVKLGKKIIKENRPDILFGSFPGPSNAFVTYKLSKKFNIPYVLDFRDGWLDDPYVPYPTVFHRKFHAYYEKKILLNAKKIIVYGKVLKDIFEKRYPGIKGKIEIMTNGFDPEDFQNLNSIKKTKNKVRLIYSGAVFIDRRESFIKFLDAISNVDKDIRNKLEIIFVGEKLKWTQELVTSKNLENIIRFTGYLPHKQALNYLSSADATLLFLAKGDKLGITGKIFEYIGLGLPVIACVERDGACSKLLNSINHDEGVCDPDNSEEIAAKIKLLVKFGLPKLESKNIEKFSRKAHSERLSTILKNII